MRNNSVLTTMGLTLLIYSDKLKDIDKGTVFTDIIANSHALGLLKL